MTTSETMTPSSDGNDSARSLSLDDAANLDWADPEEETGEVEAEPQSEEQLASDDTEAPEIDADEIDPEAALGDDEAEEDAEGEQGSTPEADDTATVTIDGKQLTVAELKKGYFREADYTRHKQVVAEKERSLEALSNRVSASVEALAELLTSTVPPMPDNKLALTDPQRHYREKVLHETAMKRVQEVIDKANAPKEALNALSEEKLQETRQAENQKLIERFPQASTPDGRAKFFDGAAKAALALGYTQEEVGQAMDHRLFALAHYAQIGMRAEAAQKKAREKVANVPPVAQPKRPATGAAAQSQQKKAAKERLARTGSLDDAVAAWSGD